MRFRHTGLLPTGIRAAVEEVIAEAAACEQRMADIAAFREETAGLVGEHGELEARAGVIEPPTLLEEWPSWAARAEAAGERWQAMRAGAWRPHLDRLEA